MFLYKWHCWQLHRVKNQIFFLIFCFRKIVSLRFFQKKGLIPKISQKKVLISQTFFWTHSLILISNFQKHIFFFLIRKCKKIWNVQCLKNKIHVFCQISVNLYLEWKFPMMILCKTSESKFIWDFQQNKTVFFNDLRHLLSELINKYNKLSLLYWLQQKVQNAVVEIMDLFSF